MRSEKSPQLGKKQRQTAEMSTSCLLCYVISRVFVTKVTLLASQSGSQSVAAATDMPSPVQCNVAPVCRHVVDGHLFTGCRSLNLHGQQRAVGIAVSTRPTDYR